MRPKKIRTPILLIVLTAITAVSCDKDYYAERQQKVISDNYAPDYLTGIEFVKVPETVFTFNETPQGHLIDGATRSFETIQGPFWISRQPVPASLYEAYYGKGRYPKNGLSFEQANRFLDRIYISTGIPVVLPTEAMFEAATINGAIDVLNKYQYLVDDGWDETPQDKQLTHNWKSPVENRLVVERGKYERRPVESFRSRSTNRFHIAIRVPDTKETQRILDCFDPGKTLPPGQSDNKNETITVNRVQFKMIAVEGGEATLGATQEQGKYAEADEAPLRTVTVSDFKIAETEVTVELWEAVMGFLPAGNSRREPRHPVINVSWYDACEFIENLNRQTGRSFRLPNEDEWEYAARGGRKSKGYIFAGSNNAQEVAVCTYKDKKGEPVRPRSADVKSKKPNELGLYDMSGNVWEWVRGIHPSGDCIQKSGSRLSLNNACRVSNRQNMQPGMKKDTFGFRIAL